MELNTILNNNDHQEDDDYQRECNQSKDSWVDDVTHSGESTTRGVKSQGEERTDRCTFIQMRVKWGAVKKETFLSWMWRTGCVGENFSLIHQKKEERTFSSSPYFIIITLSQYLTILYTFGTMSGICKLFVRSTIIIILLSWRIWWSSNFSLMQTSGWKVLQVNSLEKKERMTLIHLLHFLHMNYIITHKKRSLFPNLELEEWK